jgi:hypothetical protein
MAECNAAARGGDKRIKAEVKRLSGDAIVAIESMVHAQ